jgi:type II secretion system protein N
MAETPVGMPRYPGMPPAHAPEEATSSIQVEPSRFGKGAKMAAWIFLGVFSLVFFTIAKLPDDRIKSYIQGNLSSMLAMRGITMTVGESKISYLTGISYEMKDVSFIFPPPAEPTHVDSIEVAPTLLALLTGKLGARITVKNSSGAMTVIAGLRGSSVSASVDAQQFDIGKIGLLKIAADVNGSAIISGKADFSTSTDNLTETDANIDLDLRKIVIDAQSIQGFSIPQLTMSDGKIDATVDHGKGQVKALRLGRQDSATDDIKAVINGDIMFGKTVQNSTMNLKAVFSLSQNLMKSFAVLDMLLAAGKRPNGEFSYRLQGPLLSPNPIPAGGP